MGGGGEPWRPSSRRTPYEGTAGTVETLVQEEGEEWAVLGAAWGWRARPSLSCSFADYEEPPQLGLGDPVSWSVTPVSFLSHRWLKLLLL